MSQSFTIVFLIFVAFFIVLLLSSLLPSYFSLLSISLCFYQLTTKFFYCLLTFFLFLITLNFIMLLPANYKILFVLTIIKICDFLGLIFNSDYTSEYLLCRAFHIQRISHSLLKIVYALCDLFVSIKISNDLNNILSIRYLTCSALVPSTITSLENFILYYKVTLLYPLLPILDPIYLFTSCEITLFSYSSIGYKTCHLPSLSAFWYPLLCMVEQYSHFNYTMLLIHSKFLISKEIRLLPILKSNSSILSFLPFIINSKYFHIYNVIYFAFQYLFMLFKRFEIVNTNFMYWVTLLFNVLYICDIKSDKSA